MLAAVALALGAGRAAAAASELRTITVDGAERHYLVHAPAAAPAAPLAVVLSFHGAASTPRQEEGVTGFSRRADADGFIAVYPEGVHRLWRVFGGSPADVDFVRALLDDLAGIHPIDRRRVYATGISNGAQMAWRLACDMPEAIAAVGLVSGGYYQVCDERRPPAIIFHGTADRLLPYRGGYGQMSVRAFAAAWGAAPGCATDPSQGEIVYRQGDATGEAWHCPPHQAVLYTLDGKGHSWPGSAMPAAITSRDVDASAAMLRFFGLEPQDAPGPR